MVEIDKSVTKALNFVNRDEQNPSGNVSDKLTKTSKIRPSKENLIAEFFQFFAKIIKSFGDNSEVFSKFNKFLVTNVSESGNKVFLNIA